MGGFIIIAARYTKNISFSLPGPKVKKTCRHKAVCMIKDVLPAEQITPHYISLHLYIETSRYSLIKYLLTIL